MGTIFNKDGFKWEDYTALEQTVKTECYKPDGINWKDVKPPSCMAALIALEKYRNKHEKKVAAAIKKKFGAHKQFYNDYVDSYESGGSIIYPQELGHLSHGNEYQYLQQDHTELAFTGLPLFAIVILCLFGITIICCLAMAIGGILGYAVSNKPRRKSSRYKRISQNGNHSDHTDSV